MRYHELGSSAAIRSGIARRPEAIWAAGASLSHPAFAEKLATEDRNSGNFRPRAGDNMAGNADRPGGLGGNLQFVLGRNESWRVQIS
jgi:hypothetical protein